MNNQAINIIISESMAETQLRIAATIRSAAEDLESAADSLQSSAQIVVNDLQDGDEPKPLHGAIELVKKRYAEFLKSVEGYEAP